MQMSVTLHQSVNLTYLLNECRTYKNRPSIITHLFNNRAFCADRKRHGHMTYDFHTVSFARTQLNSIDLIFLLIYLSNSYASSL